MSNTSHKAFEDQHMFRSFWHQLNADSLSYVFTMVDSSF